VLSKHDLRFSVDLIFLLGFLNSDSSSLSIFFFFSCLSFHSFPKKLLVLPHEMAFFYKNKFILNGSHFKNFFFFFFDYIYKEKKRAKKHMVVEGSPDSPS